MTLLTLDRVTLRGPHEKKPRKRALRRLEKVDPHPPGAPSEILIVRSLSDPAPGMLARMDDARVVSKWEAAAAAALSDIRSRARRLRPGDSDTGADAIVFADEAEMIACLAERIAAGHSTAWWARALLRRLPPGTGVGPLLSHPPHLVLPIITVLLERRTAAAVFSRLTPRDVEAIAEIIGLPPVASRRTPRDFTPSRIIPDDAETPGKSVPPALQGALARLHFGTARLLAAAWIRQIRERTAPERLAVEAELLVSKSRAKNVDEATPQDASEPQPSAPIGRDARDASNVVASSDAPYASQERTANDQTEANEFPHAASHENTIAKNTSFERSASPGTEDPDAPSGTPAEDAVAPSPIEEPNGTATALGGIPFLINLYVSPIRSRSPELAAILDAAAGTEDGKWTALERLARAMLADKHSFDDDAIWSTLATLDGRPEASPALPEAADRHAATACNAWLDTVLGHPKEGRAFAGLLSAPARLFVTPVHLDVVFPARAQDIEARRAGLDLDPGWQPRFGRIIAFHYEEEGL